MDTGDILYEDEPFHDVTIKAATIHGLVNYCINNFCESSRSKASEAFVKVFFETYHWYLTTEELLQHFCNIFEKSLDDGDFVSASRVIDAIKYWVDHFGVDFEKNENALNTLNNLNTKCEERMSKYSPCELTLDDWHMKKKSNKPSEKGISPRRQSLNFHELPSEDIAKQITFLCWKGVKKVPIYEWMKYGKSAKTVNTPLLKDQIGLFNDISKYVVAMVLNHEAVADRAKAVKKFIAMSQCLLELNDFNTLLAVLGGLGHSTITRLYKTRELLSMTEKLFVKETHELLSSNHNYIKYRNKVDESEGFVMPILYAEYETSRPELMIIGVIMKDLVSLETAISDRVCNGNGEKKFINFHKMVQMSDILRTILNLREKPPNAVPQKELRSIIRVSLKSRYTEDDLYELSIQREPKREHKVSVSSSIPEQEVMFADWASGVIPEVPSRGTVEKHVQTMVEAVFKTYDLDKNGSINKEEFDALATNFPFIDNFAVLDVNCDGDISRQEMLNYFMNVNSQEMTKEFLHDFQDHSFYSPQYCVYCMGFLWGIGKTAYRCKVCHISCHKDCKNHVVMECRPNRAYTIREKSTRSLKKKMSRVMDINDWRESHDSSLNESSDNAPSPRSSVSFNGDMYYGQSFDFTEASIIEKLKERITQLEMEKISLKKDNSSLRTQLCSTESKVTSLEKQLEQVRPMSVKFMLDQLERLSTSKETDL